MNGIPRSSEGWSGRAIALLSLFVAVVSVFVAYRAEQAARESAMSAHDANLIAMEANSIAQLSNREAQQANKIAFDTLDEAKRSAQEAHALAQRALKAEVVLYREAESSSAHADAMAWACRDVRGSGYRAYIDATIRVFFVNRGGVGTSLVRVEVLHNDQVLNAVVHPIKVSSDGQGNALPIVIPPGGGGGTFDLSWSGGLFGDAKAARLYLSEKLEGQFPLVWKFCFADGQIIEYMTTSATTTIATRNECR